MLRFFEGKTQMEVSDEVGISQAQVEPVRKKRFKTHEKICINIKTFGLASRRFLGSLI